MSASEDSSTMSQLKVLDNVRHRHIQGCAGPGWVVLVHYIAYTTNFLLVLIPLKVIQNGFDPTESNYRMGWDRGEL